MPLAAGSNLDATLFGPTDPVTFQPTYSNCSSEPGGATYDIGPQGPVPAGIYHNTAGAGMIPDVDATINAKFAARGTLGVGGAICGGKRKPGNCRSR